MTDTQWNELKAILDGEILPVRPAGFIIDSPWLPNWHGISILDYFGSDNHWFEANLKAIETFPEAMFLPGFWSEYGMCTEPSAFGARVSFPEDAFPHAHPIITKADQVGDLPDPDPLTDGLLPMVMKRLSLYWQQMEDVGHPIRFSVSRGPLNIASYLMGTTEFMMLLMTDPGAAHALIEKITHFLVRYHDLQAETFESIDGILMLDDLIGFVSEDQFLEFGLPYFKQIYDRPLSVKFLHNDAPCMESIRHLPEMGVNLFNMGFEPDLNELKELSMQQVTMFGNIPPRDVLAAGTPEEIHRATTDLVQGLKDPSRVIFSCGGGMPPGVGTEQIRAFLNALREH